MPGFLITVMIDPDRRDAEILDREQAVCGIHQRGEVIERTKQARQRLGQVGRVAGLAIVVIIVEYETDPVVEQRSPVRKTELLLHHAGEAVVSRPAVEEITLGTESLRIGDQEAARQAGFAEGPHNGVQMVAAISAVLLPLTAHAVDDQVLCRIVQRIDRRIHYPLDRRVADADRRIVYAIKNKTNRKK